MSPDGKTRCRRFHVTGRVQGVFFRDSARQAARSFGLTGYARNLPDGSVEVLACGHPDAIKNMAEWLKNGPPMASVGDVQSEEVADPGLTGFTIG